MGASSLERRVWAIVPAAGSGQRFAASAATNLPKQYAALLGKTVIEWTLASLLREARIEAVVVALSRGDPHWPNIAQSLDAQRVMTTDGGVLRQDSVLNGLEFLAARASDEDWVLVHDAARPCLSREDLRALIDALSPPCAGAVLAAPIVDTVKRERQQSVETVDRQGLWRALTPQVFKFGQLRAALKLAAESAIMVTDEAQALERIGVHATLVAGSPFNIKVTRAEDLTMAREILKMTETTAAAPRLRVGQGVDVHTFGDGDHVVLAGVTIPYSRGIVAHSDGDVIIHALCDAVLGAMGDGDIGQHFPDTDPRYRGADSRVFLRTVAERMKAAGYALINADVTVLAEAPRVNPHRAAMAKNLAEDLSASMSVINIKATTTEKMGFIGRKEGLAAMATVLLGDAAR